MFDIYKINNNIILKTFITDADYILDTLAEYVKNNNIKKYSVISKNDELMLQVKSINPFTHTVKFICIDGGGKGKANLGKANLGKAKFTLNGYF